MRLLLVDSHDSFAHNLVQCFRALGTSVDVVQSSETSPSAIWERRPDLLVLGPGPGRPEEAGCLVETVRVLGGQIPLLGVCLGHQAIGLAFGGRVVRHSVVHGHATPIRHDGTSVFRGLPQPVDMTRYHSLVVEASSLPSVLRPTAWSDDGGIMGLCHRELPIEGVQFHPESVLSGASGLRLLENFVVRAAERQDQVPATPALHAAG